MTEEQFIELSLECFRNAENLYRDALLLQQHESPRSVALAVIGCEEFAKSVVYALGAIFPEEREALAKNIRKLKLHDIKHVITQYAEFAQIENAEWWAIARQEAGFGPDPHSRLMDMLHHLRSTGVSNLVSSKDEMKFWESIPNSSRLKENALYVDFLSGQIHTPDEVKNRAAAEILGLEFYLEEYRALSEVLSGMLRGLKDGGSSAARG